MPCMPFFQATLSQYVDDRLPSSTLIIWNVLYEPRLRATMLP